MTNGVAIRMTSATMVQMWCQSIRLGLGRRFEDFRLVLKAHLVIEIEISNREGIFEGE